MVIKPSKSFRDNCTKNTTSCLFRLRAYYACILYLGLVSDLTASQNNILLVLSEQVWAFDLAIVSEITVPQNNILLVSSEQGIGIIPICSFNDSCNATLYLVCFISASH